MKYTTSAALLLASLAAAQSITDLPSCSLECVADGVTGVGCELTDFECSCQKSSELTPAITPCIQESCSEVADQEKVIEVLSGICASAGFPIEVPELPTEEKPVEEEPVEEEPVEEKPVEEEPEATSVAPTIQTSVPYETEAPTLPTASVPESCLVSTFTETVTEGKPTAPAPYPTGPVGTGSPIPVPSGSTVPTSPPAEFTGAASAVRVPAVIGAFGLAAYFL